MAPKPMARLVDAPRLCQCGDHAFVSLTKGYMTMVSPEDMATLGAHYWQAHVKPRTIYATRNVPRPKKTTMRLHRQIFNAAGTVEIDHRDGNGLDNRRRNLRQASHIQNNQNRIKTSGKSSQFFGVHWVTSRKGWVASYIYNKKRILLGIFDDEVAAARARDTAILNANRADFFRLNFPVEKTG